MKREFSAGVVVFDCAEKSWKYLLLRYGAGHWDFPKGHIEKGETKEQAALRELQEEAGISAELIPNFEHAFTYLYKSRQKELVEKTVYFFIGKAESTAITLSFEHIDFAWLPYEEAMQKLTYQNARDLLQKVEVFVKKANNK